MYVRTINEIDTKLKNSKFTYARNDIAEKIIKNCRSIKGINKLNKEQKRENFRELLDFKENEIY